MKIFTWLRNNGEKTFVGIFAGIAFILAVLTLITPEWAITLYFYKHISSFILILLATYIMVFLFGYEPHVSKMASIMHELKDIVEQSRVGMAEHVRRLEELGIVQIYKNRNDPRQKEEYNSLLQKATSDLFIVGVTLKDLARSEQPMLINKASNGCSVRLLMLTPARWENEHPILDPVEPSNLKDHFASTIRNIRRIALKIADKNAGAKPKGVKIMNDMHIPKKASEISLEVRFYDQSPALSLAMADAHLDSGRMRVEFTPHNETDLEYFRPMLDLVPKDHGLFRQFFLHYHGLWDKSKAYLCIVGSKIYVNNEIDDEISRVLGLPPSDDWTSRVA